MAVCVGGEPRAQPFHQQLHELPGSATVAVELPRRRKRDVERARSFRDATVLVPGHAQTAEHHAAVPVWSICADACIACSDVAADSVVKPAACCALATHDKA
jgi:hypothetical protein